MSDYEVSKSTQSTIFRDTLYFTCDLWLTKIDSKSILWLNIKESLICEYFSLLVQNLLRQIQNKRFFCFKVHPRMYSACLVLLSNLEKIKSLSLSLLESGESFKKFLFLLSNLEKWNPFLFLFSKLENIFFKFLFLFSIGLFCLSLLSDPQ